MGTEVDWEKFSAKLYTNGMQEYLKSIALDPSDAEGLFRLMDPDGKQKIAADDLINGLFRLRGEAKALDLSRLRYELHSMNRRTRTVEQDFENRLEQIATKVDGIARLFGEASVS